MKKNIAILIHKMYDTGVAKTASKISTYLSDEKYNKTIICNDTSDKEFSFKGEVFDLNIVESKNIFKKVGNLLKRIYLTRKIKNKKQIDVSISFQQSVSLGNILTKKNNKIIVSVRTFLLKEQKNPLYCFLYKKIIKYMYNRADLVISVSEAIKDDLVNNFGIDKKKVKVIYNFYDIKKIDTLAKEPLDSNFVSLFNHPVYITAGRLKKQKGHWHLIRAFKKVKEHVPDAKLVILGKGDLENYLKHLAKELKIEEDICFIGFQSNPFKYFYNSDIYVFPSLYEGFPNALSEAMACGLPVISSDCESGPREILAPNTDINQPSVKKITPSDYGILVPVCDGEFYNGNEKLSVEEELLADSMINLYNNNYSLNKYSEMSIKRITSFEVGLIINDWERAINQ